MQFLILQTVGGFTAGGDTGGGVIELLGLAEEWTALGHEVVLITNRSDQGASQYFGGYQVHRLPSIGLHRSPSAFHFAIEMFFNPLVQGRALRSLLRATLKRPAVVLTPSPYPSDIVMAFLVKRSFGIPAAIYFHHMSPPPWWHPLRRGNPLRVATNWMLWQWALALAKVGGLLPLFHQPGELDRSPWRFDAVMSDPLFLEPSVGSGASPQDRPNHACFIGRMAPNKGVMDLPEIWRLVVGRIPGAQLVIAGRAYQRRLERRVAKAIERFGIGSNIQMRKFLSADAKRALLAESRLFVFPSYEEGWSLSVMEAAHHGVVPVVYDLPAYDYLDCDELKVPVGDREAMATLVVGLLSDPVRLETIAGRVRATVAAYDRRSIAEEQATYFARLAGPG